jgi:hypothetical protein
MNRSPLSLVLTLSALGAVAAAQPAKTPPPRPAARTPAPASQPALPDGVRVRSQLTQTAAWVGDPVAFVVEIDTAPGLDIVTADLAPEKLAIEGLELGESSSATASRADGWQTLTSTYRLTPWDPAVAPRIGPLTVRIRPPVTAEASSGTAFEIVVPGAALELRSTLPDDGSATGARDRAAPAPAPGWLASLRAAGLGLIALGVAPVVLWLAARARRPRISRPRVSSRALHAQLGAMFRELAIIDTSTPEGRRRAYDRLDVDLRAWIVEAASVPAPALTADELRARLTETRRMPAAALCDALAECERARYGPESRLPGAEALGATIDRIQTSLGGR